MYEENENQFEQLKDLLKQLIERADFQSRILNAILKQIELSVCILDKIASQSCTTLNEIHFQASVQKILKESVTELLEIYKTFNPEATLKYQQLEKIRIQMLKCCPEEKPPTPICTYEPCKADNSGVSEGYLIKSKAFATPVPFDEKPHHPYKMEFILDEEGDDEIKVPTGLFTGHIKPSPQTPHVLDFKDGSFVPGGGLDPVVFRTFTNPGVDNKGWYPPDMSGATAGDVVIMSGNNFVVISMDRGKTFIDIDESTIFAQDKVYGGWGTDRVIHYVPAIDCFVWFKQSYPGTGGTSNVNGKNTENVLKIALASPADIKKFKGGQGAWRRQWDFDSKGFGLNNFWLDYPGISFGDGFLYFGINVFQGIGGTSNLSGHLMFELPLTPLQKGEGFNYQFGFFADTANMYGTPTQNIGNENYWAGHIGNDKIRVFSSKGADNDYSWRDSTVNNWPNNTISSATPDSAKVSNWISVDKRITAATKVNNLIWFAWTASSGDGGHGGVQFPHPHIQIAKVDINQNFKVIEQSQIWNSEHAFAYPSFTTSDHDEVGVSLAWGGGGKYYGNHAVGIMNDFVVWFSEASTITLMRQINATDSAGNPILNPDNTNIKITTSRWGDYVHLRLAYPETRVFGAFGYAVLKDATTGTGDKIDPFYIEFGRNTVINPPPIVK